jgi:NTP pyrophosphatase (non-canonical NTP hydrolase)
MPRARLTLVAPADVAKPEKKPESAAERIKRLQAEAQELAREQIESLLTGMKDLAAVADEIAEGGDAYAVGAREIARRLSDDLGQKAQTLAAILRKA